MAYLFVFMGRTKELVEVKRSKKCFDKLNLNNFKVVFDSVLAKNLWCHFIKLNHFIIKLKNKKVFSYIAQRLELVLI